ncbi:MAG: hypothetical protein ABL921_22105 [Pirellula sp.]
MESDCSQLPILNDVKPKYPCCHWTYLTAGACMGIGLTVLLGIAFWAGRLSNIESDRSIWNGIPIGKVHPEMLSATGATGGSNMAVCTARIDEDSEGFFALDFVTGELKAWVYYPRMGSFGGMFMTNVQPMLGASKNPEYLLVSGFAAPPPTGGNMRLATSLIYVVDMKSGYFAAYTIPWDRTRETSGVGQMSQMFFVGGGQIREPMGTGLRKPTAPPAAGAAGGAVAAPTGLVPPGAKKPDANIDPNAPQNPPNNPANPKGKK